MREREEYLSLASFNNSPQSQEDIMQQSSEEKEDDDDEQEASATSFSNRFPPPFSLSHMHMKSLCLCVSV